MIRFNIVRAVFKKELKQIIRDKRSLIATFLLPLMMMIIYSYGVRFDVKSITLGVADYDNSSHSRDLVNHFTSSGYFILKMIQAGEVVKVENALINGDISTAVIIPSNFSSDLKRGKTAIVQILIDGVDSNTANISQGYIKAILLQFNSQLLDKKLRQLSSIVRFTIPPVSFETRVWYNPEMESNKFIVPGIIAIIMMLMGALLTSLSIVKEKEYGSFEQIVASPIKGMEFILGKISPYIILSFIDLALIVLAGWLIFEVPIKGSLLDLFLVSFIYLIATLGLGILISTIARTQQIAMFTAMLLTLLPSILLSGFVFPIKSMPIVLQWLAALVPAKYFLKAVRDIFLKGTGFETFWFETVLLTLIAMSLLFLSAKRFKKSLD